MKKRILRITVLLIMTAMISFGGMVALQTNVNKVEAVGNLTVTYLGVPLGDPVFTITNLAPGDNATRDVEVHNGGSITRMISVQGVRTGPNGQTEPKIESILDIVISESGVPLYGAGSSTGPKTVAQFFQESTGPSGITLNTVAPTTTKTYTFLVTFPEKAGNEYQNKSVTFDLTFGIITGENLLINEVFYNVDDAHGLDSPKDRGILAVNGNNVTLQIIGNGAGAVNKITVDIKKACTITQSNNAVINNSIKVNNNTGGNSSSGNTGGSTSVVSGNANMVININNSGNLNIASCGKKLGQNDEWVELYNPTEEEVSLKNWKITDNSGTTRVITANKKLKPGEYALLAKEDSVWQNWSEQSGVIKIAFGQEIGDGLENGGDILILKNPQNVEIDRMSWGTNTGGFIPPGTNPSVVAGHSTERLTPGFDTNGASDWKDTVPPTPGN